MSKSAKLYCCSSYYQVLISLVKILLEGRPSDLLLEVHGVETAEELAERIPRETDGLVKRVLVCPDSPEIDPYAQKLCTIIPTQRRRLQNYMKTVWDDVDPSEYEERNVFWDLSYAGTWFNIKKLPYRLHEDSLDSCKRIQENRPNYAYLFRPRSLRFLAARYLGAGVMPFGYSPFCSVIEVNDREGIQIPEDKVEVCSRQALMDSLSEEQKGIILRIFAGNQNVCQELTGRELLLLTEPFALTNRLTDEQTQIRMYRDIVEKYAEGRPLLIKAHPRDTLDYAEIFPEAQILERNLPMEILDFYSGFQPDLALTVTSSAVFGVPGARQTLSLGIEFLRQYQK